MHEAQPPSGAGATFLAIFGFLAGLVSIVVGLSVILGLSEQLEALGSWVMFALGLLTVSIASFFGYRRMAKGCWTNARKVRRVRRTLHRFLEDHDATRLSATLEVGEIYLIQSCKKARALKLRVKEARFVDPAPPLREGRAELVLDKGRQHGLRADMKLAVYHRRRARQLCVVKLRHPGEPSTSAANIASLGTRTTRLTVTLDADWNLPPNDLTGASFEVRLIEPAPQSVINELLGVLAHEVDREWSLRDLRE